MCFAAEILPVDSGYIARADKRPLQGNIYESICGPKGANQGPCNSNGELNKVIELINKSLY